MRLVACRSNWKDGFSVCVGGISGVGKTSLLRSHVETLHADTQITGSSIVKSIIAPATVSDFDRLPILERELVRQLAIVKLAEWRSRTVGRLLVDGHFTLRNRVTMNIEPIFTDSDRRFFDALVLVQAPAEKIVKWRSSDDRLRVPETIEQIRQHQEMERVEAERLSEEMNVPLGVIIEVEVLERRRALLSFLNSWCSL